MTGSKLICSTLCIWKVWNLRETAKWISFLKRRLSWVGFEHFSISTRRAETPQISQTLWCVRGNKRCTKRKNNDILLVLMMLEFPDSLSLICIKVTPTADFSSYFFLSFFFSEMIKRLPAATSHTDSNLKLSCQADLLLIRCNCNSSHFKLALMFTVGQCEMLSSLLQSCQHHLWW